MIILIINHILSFLHASSKLYGPPRLTRQPVGKSTEVQKKNYQMGYRGGPGGDHVLGGSSMYLVNDVLYDLCVRIIRFFRQPEKTKYGGGRDIGYS